METAYRRAQDQIDDFTGEFYHIVKEFIVIVL